MAEMSLIMQEFLKELEEYKQFALSPLYFENEEDPRVKIALKRRGQVPCINAFLNKETGKVYEIGSPSIAGREENGRWLHAYVEVRRLPSGRYERPWEAEKAGREIIWAANDDQRLTRGSGRIDEDWCWESVAEERGYGSQDEYARMTRCWFYTLPVREAFKALEAKLPEVERLLLSGKYGHWSDFVSQLVPWAVATDSGSFHWPDTGKISCWLADASDRLNGRPQRLRFY